MSGLIRYVTVARFREMSGYTVDAVDKKRSNGLWLEGVVWVKAPDGES